MKGKGNRELRIFGLTMAMVLAVIGGAFLLKGSPVYHYFFVISGLFLVFGLIFPALLMPVQGAWMKFAGGLGWVMTRAILILFYYLIFCPIGILARLFRKDFLDLKFERGKESYWIKMERDRIDPGSYENQF